MTIAIQRASIQHLELILPLVRAYHEFEEVDTTESARESSIRQLLSNHSLGGIWLIYSDKTLAGYIALCQGYSIEFGGYDAFIDEFYIQTEFRGRGLGKQTLEFVKTEAKKIGIRALHLEVAHTNTNAQRLYSQAQFKPREKYMLMSVTL